VTWCYKLNETFDSNSGPKTKTLKQSNVAGAQKARNAIKALHQLQSKPMHYPTISQQFQELQVLKEIKDLNKLA
jgi:hypothetical protein